jgi:hypothetical protein
MIMSSIIIKEVKTKKDLNKFIDFANDLYKGNDCYVPTLRSDIKDMFNRDKNGAYEYCDSIGVLAYKDKKGGILWHRTPKKRCGY